MFTVWSWSPTFSIDLAQSIDTSDMCNIYNHCLLSVNR